MKMNPLLTPDPERDKRLGITGGPPREEKKRESHRLSARGSVVGLGLVAAGLIAAGLLLDALGSDGRGEPVQAPPPVVTEAPPVERPDVEPGDSAVRVTKADAQAFLNGYAEAAAHSDSLYMTVVDRFVGELTTAGCLALFDGPFTGPTEDDATLHEQLTAAKQYALETAPYERSFVVHAIAGLPEQSGTGVVAYSLGVSCH